MSALSRIIIHRAGLGASMQDEGRRGFLQYGVGWSGAMDWARAKLACHLAHAPRQTPFFEIGLGGLELAIENAPLRLGFAGPGFHLTLNDKTMPAPCGFLAPAGSHLAITPGRKGVWAYLAFGGNCPDIAPVLGSYASHARAGLAAWKIKTGAALAVQRVVLVADRLTHVPDPCGEQPESLALLEGPQWNMFSREAQERLLADVWRIDRRMDRMGYWLEGERLAFANGHDIPSEGMVLGAVEVSGDGRPVVVLADGQPTGGYPKIAVLAQASLPHFVQLRPGAGVRFAPISREAALQARQTLEAAIAAGKSL